MAQEQPQAAGQEEAHGQRLLGGVSPGPGDGRATQLAPRGRPWAVQGDGRRLGTVPHTGMQDAEWPPGGSRP